VTAVARFRDRRAAIVWLIVLLWDAAVVLLCAIVWAEGGGWKGWLALGVFGLAGLGLSAFVLNLPLLGIDVAPGGVTVTRRYPFRRRRQVWPLAEVIGATVVEQDDAESGPYYACRIDVRGSEPINLFSKSTR
jgi:hypothetical protein